MLSEETKDRVYDAVKLLQDVCHQASVEGGWWVDHGNGKSNPLHFSNKLCLMHSEISEAMEADRKSLMDDKLPHRPGREVEMADLLIRAFDLGGGYHMDLAGALVEKMAYNAGRRDHTAEARAEAHGKRY